MKLIGELIMRVAWAGPFLFHGWGKLFPANAEMNTQMANDMLGSTTLWLGLGIAELLVGILILVGLFLNDMLTRLAGGLGAAIIAGAVFKVHWANGYSFMNPGVGWEFHAVLIGVGIFFLLRGNGSGTASQVA